MYNVADFMLNKMSANMDSSTVSTKLKLDMKSSAYEDCSSLTRGIMGLSQQLNTCNYGIITLDTESVFSVES